MLGVVTPSADVHTRALDHEKHRAAADSGHRVPNAQLISTGISRGDPASIPIRAGVYPLPVSKPFIDERLSTHRIRLELNHPAFKPPNALGWFQELRCFHHDHGDLCEFMLSQVVGNDDRVVSRPLGAG